MRRFQYRTAAVPGRHELTAYLDELGRAGWEAVSCWTEGECRPSIIPFVYYNNLTTVVLLKREIENATGSAA